MTEIERKFLVVSEAYKNEASQKTRIIQGFLNTHPDRTIRVRLKGDRGFLTIKGKSSDDGLTRFEWEHKISSIEAEKLLSLCEKGVIDKMRYEIKVGNHIFEVDEFFGTNEGLTIAEIELSNEMEPFIRPNWLGKEVTGEIKYYNSQLSKKPFKTWK